MQYHPEDYLTTVPKVVCEINASYNTNTEGSAEGTVFPSTIKNTHINTLFDTGASRSVMSGDMYRKLKLEDLDSTGLPKVVGADGTSLGVMGRVKCEITLGKRTFKQTFLVCQNITRPVILGKEFARDYFIGVHWSKRNTRVLTENLQPIIETPELKPRTKYSVSLQQAAKLPPRSCAIVNVDINTTSTETVKIIPDELCHTHHPNMVARDDLYADLSKRAKDTVFPYQIVNLSSTENLYLPKNHVVAFAERDEIEGDVFDIEEVLELEMLDTTPRMWVPKRTSRSNAKSAPIVTDKNIQKIFSSASNFIKSPAEVEPHQKVDLKDAPINEETKDKFNNLCNKFDCIISKGSDDIGKTLLVEMDIDTGNSPPIASRPYTLPLKHHEWVRNEITTLERAGIIIKSISPWASPVVIVPKKSAPGEPPQRRMCVDFRKLNTTQPDVQNMTGGKGCISLVPLPKIDELYAKLQGYKIFSTLDLRSGYYHIGLSEDAKPKTAFVVAGMGKYQFNRVPFGLAQAPAYFQRLINEVLTGLDFAMGYLDDIIIFSKTEEEHLRHLEIIFKRLRGADLKLKLQKCSFFKKHIQYLGHLLSEEGIQPLPEKLESISKMPTPKNAKQVKQFLGLVGYYRKFVPRFADISRILTKLTCKNEEFKWTTECEKCFKLLKEYLQEAPILRYPDPAASYTLYTDASKYAYAEVLTQTVEDTDHPVAYVSGLFRGSQLNWAALTKEAYAIYMSVKKLSFYLDSAKILVRSDHLPLKRFLEKNTLNSKVNNWAVELESQKIEFKFIDGVKNVLADTLSRLIEIDEDVKLPEEKEGHEFGYVPFEKLPPAKVEMTEEVITEPGTKPVIEIHHIDPLPDLKVEIPVSNAKMKEFQEQDERIQHLRNLCSAGKLNQNIFIMENDILKKRVTEQALSYKAVVVPDILKESLLILAHDEQGHNGFKRTYNALKTLYYWKGMKRHIQLHCRRCRTCARHNVHNNEVYKEHFKAPSQTMEFLTMDLIGEFHPASSKGNRYALTAICMLTGFTWCIPLKTKKAEEVVAAYMNHIYCVCGPSKTILSDNGSEFKNNMWKEVFQRFKTEHRYTPIYSPQCNGRIEGFHRFLKACVGKQIQQGLEWDDLVWKATAAYNFFPTESSGFSPFFLMFGREANAKHMILAENSTRYLEDDQGILNAQLMMKLFQVVAYNLAKSRAARDGNKRTRKNFRPKHIKLNHPVVVKDHTAKAFEPRSTDHLCVGFKGKNRVFVKDNHGKVTLVSRKDVSPCEMDVKIAELFNESRNNSKTRDAQQLMPAKQIPDLEWKFEEEVQLVEPVLIQIYHLPKQSATTENDRPECQQLVEAKKTENQDTNTSQEDQEVATTENDRPDRSTTEVQRLQMTKESDRQKRLQLVETKTENQNTKTGQEDQGIATIETDRAERSQTTASESSAFKILETLIFLLISLATVAVLF